MAKLLRQVISIFCLCFISNVMAQNTVTGKITEASNGIPIPGVNVQVKNTTNGTVSDFDGNYSIDVNTGDILIISYLGFTTKEITVGDSSTIDVKLEASSQDLDEVIVTALGIKRERKALGYAVTQLESESVNEVKTTNAINALQGKIAGVNISPPATGASGSSRVTIRGASSLTGNSNPLYVVDGTPIDNTQLGEAGPYGGSDFGDGISSINPDDIESISVLKGGGAAALYGSRGINGVILITTKNGSEKKGFGVEYSSQVQFISLNNEITDFQRQYGQGNFGEAPTNADDALGSNFSAWGARLDTVDEAIQFDGVVRPYQDSGNNLNRFYRTGTTLINSLAIGKGGEGYNTRFSFTNLDNQDILPNSNLNRKSFGLNGNVVLADKLTLNISSRYIIEKAKNRPRISDAPGNANFSVNQLPANINVNSFAPGFNEDGTELAVSTTPFTTNPYWSANRFSNFDRKGRLIASANLNYQIADWLDFSIRTGIDNISLRSTQIEPYGTAFVPLGTITERQRTISQVDTDLILTFNKTIKEDYGITAFVGANKVQRRDDLLNLRGERFVIPFLEILGNVENSSQFRTLNERAFTGVYGSLELSYQNLLYLTATGRNDWFSPLTSPNSTGSNNIFYPSINGSFIFSELIDSDILNLGRLRGGYSEVGDANAVNPYTFSLPYRIFGQGHQGSPLGDIDASSVPNTTLKPRVKKEFEIGLDLVLFQKRLNIDIAYYENTITDDLIPVDISNTSGYQNTLVNLGELKNRGVEFLIGWTPVVTDNFKWTTSYNLAYNDSEVISTDEVGSPIRVGEQRTFDADIRQIVGQPAGVIYGTAFKRNDAGDIFYNDTGLPQIAAERKILGQGIHPITMGLNNTFSYKNFTFSFLIDAKFGAEIYSGTNRVAYGSGLHKETLNGRENNLTVTGVTESTSNDQGVPFTFEHDETSLQTYYGSNNGVGRIAEEFIENADFIKFRQFSLNYNLPNSLIDNTFINDATIGIIGRDLFFLLRNSENIDPEASYNAGNTQGLEYFGLPPVRTVGLNLNITF